MPKELKNGHGDPHAHEPSIRSETAQTDGMMGARGADSTPAKEQPRPSSVQKDDPDRYGVV